MKEEEYKDRLEKIYELLIQMSMGNFMYKIERSDKVDELEALVLSLNMTSEQMKYAFMHQAFVYLNDAYKFATQYTLVVNTKGYIASYNTRFVTLLKHKSGLKNIHIKEILSKDSKEDWESYIEPLLGSGKEIDESMKLDFQTTNGLLFRANCNILGQNPDSKFKNHTLITGIEFVNSIAILERIDIELAKQPSSKKIVNKKFSPTESDLQMIREAKEYLEQNAHLPYMSTKDLAFKVGTNQQKLKDGFKLFTGTTIAKFQKEQRLRKAHLLITATSLKIKEIATLAGFNSPEHFQRVFKLRYKISPKNLRSIRK